MKNEFGDLLEKYLTNTITEEEEKRLIALSREEAGQEALSDQLYEHIAEGTYAAEHNDARHRQIYEQLQAEMAREVPVRRIRTSRIWWAAAAITGLIALSFYIWSPKQQIVQADNALEKIMPGKSGAILTLANGTQLQLDSLKNGAISSQQGAEIILKDDQVAYNPTGETTAEEVFNTISTPNGRQFRLTLPDGTKAWLNAASSIRYPTAFAGKDRRITVTGEVYLEVVSNPQHPFKVGLKNGAEIQVLGTSFNINSYEEEPAVRTTLLEGKISLHKAAGKEQVILEPGDQAVMDHVGQQLATMKLAKPEDVIAWKNGLFSFTDADIYTVMRQLARWYNIEVRFEGKMPERRYNGKIDKMLSLGEVLKGLTKTHINYKIEDGNKITILP